MAENKFIKHLKGEQAVGSLVEIKNQNTPASFGNMPQGTSDSNVKYSDVRGDVTVVANGTTAWKLNNSALTLAPIVNGDGTDYTGKYEVSGAGLWVNSTYTFPSTGDPNHPVAMIFNPNSKWVLKLCGDNLIVNDGNTLELTVVITIGSSNIISKQFTIREQANQFCKELVIDFDESSSDLIKASGSSTMQLQVLCGTANASARIYNGMTTLTVLQRKVDAAVVSGTFANVEEVLRDGILPSDYFNNAAYIAQIEDGDSAYAVFTRDGDTVALSGWAQPIPDQTNNAGKFLTTDGSLMSWEELTISNVSGLQDELDGLQDQITTNKGTMDTHIANTSNPHKVTKAQVGLGNVNNTSDLNKPISTATQNALNLKADKTTTYTKTETDILLSGKQDNISDLAAIRSNAQAGKAASDTIATYGNIVTHNVSEFATAAQGAKADTAVQPSDLGNGTITITQGGITKGTFTTNQSGNTTIALDAGGGGGAVNSVNGKTGVVVLTATDVGALPDSTVIPDAQIQSDWNQADNTKVDFIKNKPTIPAAQVNSDWNANSGVAQILNKPTIPTVNNPTITITQGGATKGSFTLNQATGDTIDLDAGGGGGSGSGRNIGDIFYTARTDESLAGAVECNGGTYSTEDYEGDGSIGELLEAGKLPYVSLAQYTTLLSTNGVVGVFGWDGTGTTTFRVPTLQDIFIECGKASELGDYIGAGLPNITTGEVIHAWNNNSTAAWTSGAISAPAGNGTGLGGANLYSHTRPAVFDASKSNSIYGNSDTVQPKAIKYRAMIQLFNATTDEAVATVGTVVAQVGALNSHRLIDFQIPTAENGYTWYRKYADGWVEQGGRTTTSNQTITFPIPFADVPNMTWGLCTSRRAASYDAEIFFGSITTTNFISGSRLNDAVSPGYMWHAVGMAAN